MLTDKRLAAIKARCEAATDGPWQWEGENDYRHWLVNGVLEDVLWTSYEDSIRYREPDAAFIAAAREDVQDLLAEVERAREQEAHWHNAWIDAHIENEQLREHAAALTSEVVLLRELLETLADYLVAPDGLNNWHCIVCGYVWKDGELERHASHCQISATERALLETVLSIEERILLADTTTDEGEQA